MARFLPKITDTITETYFEPGRDVRQEIAELTSDSAPQYASFYDCMKWAEDRLPVVQSIYEVLYPGTDNYLKMPINGLWLACAIHGGVLSPPEAARVDQVFGTAPRRIRPLGPMDHEKATMYVSYIAVHTTYPQLPELLPKVTVIPTSQFHLANYSDLLGPQKAHP